jgi:hypothetical protein
MDAPRVGDKNSDYNAILRSLLDALIYADCSQSNMHL